MKEVIAKILQKSLKEKNVKMKKDKIIELLEIPPSIEMGDYSFPCFSLTEDFQDEPQKIAMQLRAAMGNTPPSLEDIQTIGPYINFFLNRKDLGRKVVWEAITQKKNYGKSKIGDKKKIVVEFSSPNVAKPFGIGHLRSTIIGNSMANICEFVGFKPIKINYLGDWGTQYGRIIFGFDKFGSEKKLEKNPIKHLLDIYVKVNKNKKYDEPSREQFKKLEQRDKKSLMIWKVFRDLSIAEFDKIYKTFKIEFDEITGESNYVKYSEKVVDELKSKNLLEKSQGALIVNLEKYKLGVCLIKKNDGTTLYATRDIATAIKRYKKYKFDRMIYEVGQEQKLYFKQLFKVLELMGYEWAKNCVHMEHGLYLGKDQKKLATRKGKTVFMEDIIEETNNLAKKEIKKRTKKISKKELEKRASKISTAAIFYGDLKNNRKNSMVFDINKFISFEGDTGPYIQYSYARASSILRKTKNKDKFKVYDLEQKELELVKKLSQFQEIVLSAYSHLNPSIIANYSYQLSQKFNEFYHACPVIGSKQEAFRLALVEAFRQVLKNSLNLLGIETLEKM